MSTTNPQPISLDAMPAVIPGYEFKIVKNRICLVDTLGRPRISLSVPGALIWKHCAQNKTIAAIRDALIDACPDNAKHAQDDVVSTLREFYKRRIISFRCDHSAVSDKTYHINLSELLAHELDKRGWKAARPGELAEFAFFLRQARDIQVAKYQTYDLFLTGSLGSKHLMAERIIHSGNGSIIPETYTSFAAFEQHTSHETDGLWFLKLGFSGRQRDVYCFRGHDELRKQVEKFHRQPYVIQRGIADPYLIDGRKITLRVMALILADKSVYVHQNACVKTQNVAYDATNTSGEVQYLHHGVRRTTINEYPQLAQVMQEINGNIATTIKLFTDDYCVIDDENCYSFLGVDIVLDSNQRPYLIEINHTPGFYLKDVETSWHRTRVSMIDDWLEIVMEGKRDAEAGGFVKVV